MTYVPCACQNWHGPVIVSCLNCGHIFISTRAIRCIVCNNGNLVIFPIRDNHFVGKQLTFEWLEKQKGFEYIRKRLEVDNKNVVRY